MEGLKGVILSWDGTTLGESFYPGMERLQGSHSVLGWNDSRGVLLSSDGTTQGTSFCPGMERFQGSHSIQRTEGLQGSNSLLGWNNSQEWDRSNSVSCSGDNKVMVDLVETPTVVLNAVIVPDQS